MDLKLKIIEITQTEVQKNQNTKKINAQTSGFSFDI